MEMWSYGSIRKRNIVALNEYHDKCGGGFCSVKNRSKMERLVSSDTNETRTYRFVKIPRRLKRRYAAFILLMLLIGLAFAIYFVTKSLMKSAQPAAGREGLTPPDPEEALPPSASKLHVFRKGAVCTDGPPCSAIGRDILLKNGSAVDAAIASMFCNGFFNMHSTGIGGGFLMTVYRKDEGKVYVINARETAPGKVTEDMFDANPTGTLKGPLACGVPGEVRGLWAAHQRWGILPWSELIEPTIEICRTGYNLSKSQWDGFLTTPYIKNDGNLRKMFYDEKTDKFRPVGSLIMPNKKICRTLAKIAENGGDDLYNGSLAKEFQADLELAGSIITLDDLNRYEPEFLEPIAIQLKEGNTFYSVPPPGSGALLGFILNILSGYNFTKDSINGVNNTVLTYHRIIESFKYAFAKRTLMGDGDFIDNSELLANLTSLEYASLIRMEISDNRTYDSSEHYGAEFFSRPDNGTAHIAVLAPNGDAVSVTSSVNFYFGAGWTTRQTGIIMNNVLDDFSWKFNSHADMPGSEANLAEPYKRPLSSMAPSIMVDERGDVRMVIGAAGGTKITTGIAQVMARHLWFGQTIKEATDAPRFHHQLEPMEISYEYGLVEDVIKGLKSIGHKMKRYRDRGSIICALSINETGIYANSDYRKGGEVYGLN